jgi:hypothetical protein
MARMFLSNKECWMEHLRLDYKTGLDPEGIRVRNAQGIDSVDFFFPGTSLSAFCFAHCNALFELVIA